MGLSNPPAPFLNPKQAVGGGKVVTSGVYAVCFAMLPIPSVALACATKPAASATFGTILISASYSASSSCKSVWLVVGLQFWSVPFASSIARERVGRSRKRPAPAVSMLSRKLIPTRSCGEMVAERLRAMLLMFALKGREENFVEPNPVTEDWVMLPMFTVAVELLGTVTSKPKVMFAAVVSSAWRTSSMISSGPTAAMSGMLKLGRPTSTRVMVRFLEKSIGQEALRSTWANRLSAVNSTKPLSMKVLRDLSSTISRVVVFEAFEVFDWLNEPDVSVKCPVKVQFWH